MPYTPELVAKQADLTLPRADESSASSRLNWLPYAIIAILLCPLYCRVGMKLVYDWSTLRDYSHGPFVPLFAAFLVWDKRKVLSTTPIKQTWAGIALVVLGLAVLILGIYGVELFTARISFVMLLTGLIWTFFGGASVPALRVPLLVLILPIPFPPPFSIHITFLPPPF